MQTHHDGNWVELVDPAFVVRALGPVLPQGPLGFGFKILLDASKKSTCDFKYGSFLIALRRCTRKGAMSPFAAKEYPQKSCPVSQQWSNTLVRLPLFHSLDETSQMRVISRVNSFGGRQGFVMRPCEHWSEAYCDELVKRLQMVLDL